MLLVIAIAFTVVLTLAAGAQSADDTLEQGFKEPLDPAKPRTWWHWTAH